MADAVASARRREVFPAHRRWAVGLAALGCAIATYLALYQLRVIASVWDPVFGEQSRRVLDSAASRLVARWIGVPDAALGAVAYLVEAVLAGAGGADRWRTRPWLVLLYGLTAGLLATVAVGLVAVQSLVVDAWCLLCLASAVLSWGLVALAFGESRAAVTTLAAVWHSGPRWAPLWAALRNGLPAQRRRRS